MSQDADSSPLTPEQQKQLADATERARGLARAGKVAAFIPSEVRVGTSTPLFVDMRPADSRWKVNDATLARITPSESLYAKRVGSVTVSLISEINPGNDPYAQQSVQIVP